MNKFFNRKGKQKEKRKGKKNQLWKKKIQVLLNTGNELKKGQLEDKKCTKKTDQDGDDEHYHHHPDMDSAKKQDGGQKKYVVRILVAE